MNAIRWCALLGVALMSSCVQPIDSTDEGDDLDEAQEQEEVGTARDAMQPHAGPGADDLQKCLNACKAVRDAVVAVCKGMPPGPPRNQCFTEAAKAYGQCTDMCYGHGGGGCQGQEVPPCWSKL